jgi:hypothetical protein
MTRKTQSGLITEAQVIRDEVVSGANTKLRVYEMLVNTFQSYLHKDQSGDLSTLSTTAKNTLVAAINELYAAIQGLDYLSAEDIDTLAEINAIITDADLAKASSLTFPKTALVKTGGNDTTGAKDDWNKPFATYAGAAGAIDGFETAAAPYRVVINDGSFTSLSLYENITAQLRPGVSFENIVAAAGQLSGLRVIGQKNKISRSTAEPTVLITDGQTAELENLNIENIHGLVAAGAKAVEIGQIGTSAAVEVTIKNCRIHAENSYALRISQAAAKVTLINCIITNNEASYPTLDGHSTEELILQGCVVENLAGGIAFGDGTNIIDRGGNVFKGGYSGTVTITKDYRKLEGTAPSAPVAGNDGTYDTLTFNVVEDDAWRATITGGIKLIPQNARDGDFFLVTLFVDAVGTQQIRVPLRSTLVSNTQDIQGGGDSFPIIIKGKADVADPPLITTLYFQAVKYSGNIHYQIKLSEKS